MCECEKGVKIKILTNSLATNNHTAVHSAYATYRKRLLNAGAELWEARADAAKIITDDGESLLEQLTLHTKGLLIDRKRDEIYACIFSHQTQHVREDS